MKAQAFSDEGRLNCDVQVAAFATSTRGKYGTVPPRHTCAADVSDCTPNSDVGEGQGTEEKEYSAMLHKALEGAVLLHTFPKTTVDVFALILQSGGCKSSTSSAPSTPQL